MSDFLPFALPDIGKEEIAEVLDSLRSGWLTTGPKTKRFEQEFADFIGSGVEAVAVNSATSGLHLALEANGVSPGDEVITTPHTFTATAEVIRYLGADPVFVDIDPRPSISIRRKSNRSSVSGALETLLILTRRVEVSCGKSSYLNYDGKESQAVADVVDGGWITMGEKTKEFETRFSIFLGNNARSTATSSGTAALHLAMLSLGIGPGDEVIIPSLTFIADINVVKMVHLMPTSA